MVFCIFVTCASYYSITLKYTVLTIFHVEMYRFWEQRVHYVFTNGSHATLPVVLYGCGTWSLKLREERRLRVFENRVLRRAFGPKRDEVTGEWRKLHNEELSDLYSLPNIVRVVKSRRMRWAGHVACVGEGRGVHRVLVGKPEGKIPSGRPRRRREDNIKMGAGWSWLRIGTGGGRLWVR